MYLEYSRACQELWQKGMYVELHAYQHHVFMDWHFVDDEKWKEIHDVSNGAGVESMQAKWEEMFGEKKEEEKSEKEEEVKIKKPRRKVESGKKKEEPKAKKPRKKTVTPSSIKGEKPSKIKTTAKKQVDQRTTTKTKK